MAQALVDKRRADITTHLAAKERAKPATTTRPKRGRHSINQPLDLERLRPRLEASAFDHLNHHPRLLSEDGTDSEATHALEDFCQALRDAAIEGLGGAAAVSNLQYKLVVLAARTRANEGEEAPWVCRRELWQRGLKSPDAKLDMMVDGPDGRGLDITLYALKWFPRTEEIKQSRLAKSEEQDDESSSEDDSSSSESSDSEASATPSDAQDKGINSSLDGTVDVEEGDHVTEEMKRKSSSRSSHSSSSSGSSSSTDSSSNSSSSSSDSDD